MKFNQKGFGTVILAMLLLLASISATTVLYMARAKSSLDKSKETKQKLVQIQEAINKFVLENNRLPCPASIILPIDNANFGVEKRSGTTCDFADVGILGTDDILQGTIPTQQLGLSPNAAIDSWGNKISYVVDINFAKDNGFIDSLGTVDDLDGYSGRTKIKRDFTDLVFINEVVVFALVSHGKTGSEAFNQYATSGTTTIVASSAVEFRNVAVNKTFIALFYDKAEIQKNLNNQYCGAVSVTVNGTTLIWKSAKVGEYVYADKTCPGGYMAPTYFAIDNFKNLAVKKCLTGGIWSSDVACLGIPNCIIPSMIGTYQIIPNGQPLLHNSITEPALTCGTGTIQFKCVVDSSTNSLVARLYKFEDHCAP